MDFPKELDKESFFKEKQNVLCLLQQLCSTREKIDKKKGNLDFHEYFHENYEELKRIMEKYQEKSTLLDVHLEMLVIPVMNRVKVISRKNYESVDPCRETFKLQHITCPFTMKQLHFTLKFIYLLCKIRGFKTVIRLFPHEAADLEPALHMLRCQDESDFSVWEIRYSLLLWLSVLALIPFDLDTVDSSRNETLVYTLIEQCKHYLEDSGPTRDAAAYCLSKLLTRPDLEGEQLSTFLNWCIEGLNRIGLERREPTRESNGTSVFLMSGILKTVAAIYKYGHRKQLLAHRDVASQLLEKLTILTNLELKADSTNERKLKLKVLQRLGMIFLPTRVATWRYQRGQRRLMQSISQGVNAKAGSCEVECAIEDEIVVNVPAEIEEIVEYLLNGLRDSDTVVRWSAAKGIGRITSRLTKDLASDVVEFILQLFHPSEGHFPWHGGCLALAELARRGLLLPESLPEVVPLVTRALVYDERKGHTSIGANVRDAACYVCWAFARAYSPEVMKPFVLNLSRNMLITALFDRETNCRRAASAAFQENVGRQGHENFKHGIEILAVADYYNLGNRKWSYCCAAPFVSSFEIYRRSLIDYLVNYKLFHWIRELSATSLGLLTEKDAKYVAETGLRELIPKTLSSNVLVRHGSILGIGRILLACAQSGYNLCEDSFAAVRDVVLKVEKAKLYRGKGGEWIRTACALLIAAIADSGHPLSDETQLRFLDTIDETMKHPKCPVKDAALLALEKLTYNYFDDNINPHERCKTDTMQIVFQPKYESIMHPVCDKLVKRTVSSYCNGLLIDMNPSARRGCALALGALPARFSAANEEVLQQVLSTLLRLAKFCPKEPITQDPETRKNAVASLCKIVVKVGLSIGSVTCRKLFLLARLDLYQFNECMEGLLQCCMDFQVDNRGDVGSWVRAEALRSLCTIIGESRKYGLDMLSVTQRSDFYEKIEINGESKKIIHHLAEKNLLVLVDVNGNLSKVSASEVSHLRSEFRPTPAHPEELKLMQGFLSSELCFKVCCALLTQLSAKLSSIRAIAGDLLTKFLTEAEDANCGVPITFSEAEQLRSTIFGIASLDWTSEEKTFSTVVGVLDIQSFIDAVLNGLVLSVGDVTKTNSITAQRSSALVERCKIWVDAGRISHLMVSSLEGIIISNRKKNRITIPTMKTLLVLLEAGVFREFNLQSNKRLCEAVEQEIVSTKSIPKLEVAIGCFTQFLFLSSRDLRKRTLKQLLELLGHQYPKIRQKTFHKTYLSLLALGEDEVSELMDVENRLQEANECECPSNKRWSPKDESSCVAGGFQQTLDVLINIQWDKVSTIVARAESAKLCRLFGMKPAESFFIVEEKDLDFDQARTEKENGYESMIKTLEMGF